MDIFFNELVNDFKVKFKNKYKFITLLLLIISISSILCNALSATVLPIDSIGYMIANFVIQIIFAILSSVVYYIVLLCYRKQEINKQNLSVISKNIARLLMCLLLINCFKITLLISISLLISFLPFLRILYDFILYIIETLALAISLISIYLVVDTKNNIPYILYAAFFMVKKQILSIVTAALPYIVISLFVTISLMMVSTYAFDVSLNQNSVTSILELVIRGEAIGNYGILIIAIFIISFILLAIGSMFLVCVITCIYGKYRNENDKALQSVLQDYNKLS